MDQSEDAPDTNASSWRTPTAGEKKIFLWLAGVLGALSAIAQFLGTFIDNGLILFAVCLALTCLFVGAVMAFRRVRRAAVWTVALLVAVAAGGTAGYAMGRSGGGGGGGGQAGDPTPSAGPVRSPVVTSSGEHSQGINSPGVVTTHDVAFALSAEPAGSRAVAVNVTKIRNPTPAHAFWLVLEIHGVNGHSEFYPSKDLTVVPEKYRYSITLPDDAGAKYRRTGRVYEVDEATAKRMTASKEEGRVIPLEELLKPPCDDCSVSDEVEFPFTE